MPVRSPARALTLIGAALLLLACPVVARADVVLDWNAITLDTIRATRLPPPRATRLLAMVHVAMYDAVNGIEGVHTPYSVTRRPVPGASAAAAAATAAHDILTDQFPERSASFDEHLAASLADQSLDAARHKGVAWGQYVAGQILKLRRDDGAEAYVSYVPSGELGRWEPTPPAYAPALLPQWPYVVPFAISATADFRPAPPPELTSFEFTEAFMEVKALGAADSSTRTDDETELAFFWEDGAGSATPPGHWQIIAREFAIRAGFTLSENARLFALLSIAQADAAIAAWDCKYYFDHFRPYTGITRAAEDGNDLTDPDPFWLPLLPTPPFPSYASGHSTFSGASAAILAQFFGDVAFSSAAPDPDLRPEWLYDESGDPIVRSWPSLTDAAREAGRSRIYGGIHWEYDNVAGLARGRELAAFILQHFLLPWDE